MATAADVSMTNKRSARGVGKRRMSRDLALPDVTNFPDAHFEERASRRQSLASRTASLTSASGQENGDGNGEVKAGGQGDLTQLHVQPERAAKIAARAKMKAVITPRGPTRRRKTSQRAPPAPVHHVTTPPLPPLPSPPPLQLSEEWMEMDRPALVLQLQMTIVDIDHHDDYLLAPDYAQDIVCYLKKQESQVVLPPDYLSINPEITSQMRGILVDWLIQVHAHEQLEEESLQLCVRLTDLYLARAPLPVTQLQLLGVTALLLAAKFVERFPPLVSTLCSLTAGTYREGEVVEMERRVLGVLNFALGLPLPCPFLARLLLVHPHDRQVERLASYLIDLSLPSIHFVSMAPSVVAASALYVARSLWLLAEREPWSAALVYYSGYTRQQLAPAVTILAKILLRAPVSKYQGARQKHAAEDPYGGISMDPVLDSHPLLLQLARDSLHTAL